MLWRTTPWLRTGSASSKGAVGAAVSNEVVGSVGEGLLVLLGVSNDDTSFDLDILARKIANLRIFCDKEDKMNLSALDVNAEILLVSNFTLCADTKKGNRPSFSNAMQPQTANEMYVRFKQALLENGVKKVETGVFGAEMQIDTTCDGPVTIILDTTIWR